MFYNIFNNLDDKVLSQSLFSIYVINTLCGHVCVHDNDTYTVPSTNNASTDNQTFNFWYTYDDSEKSKSWFWYQK